LGSSVTGCLLALMSAKGAISQTRNARDMQQQQGEKVEEIVDLSGQIMVGVVSARIA
jgi:hypothetical protein